MKSIRVTEVIEHPFIYDAAEPPVALNDLAKVRAYELSAAPIPETDLIRAVWKISIGCELSVPDKCADKLIALGYAEAVEPVSA